MKNGSIALARIPQDASGKLRPILILKKMPNYEDYLLCAVSSQLRHYIDGFDLLIDEKDDNFELTGLRCSSVIRLGSLAVLPLSNLAGTIGYIDAKHYDRLIKNLTNYLQRP